jgi:hypothetical protein
MSVEPTNMAMKNQMARKTPLSLMGVNTKASTVLERRMRRTLIGRSFVRTVKRMRARLLRPGDSGAIFDECVSD